MILGEILFEEFQDGCHGGHLGSEQYDFSNSEYSCPHDAPSSIKHMVQEVLSFGCQGGHLAY